MNAAQMRLMCIVQGEGRERARGKWCADVTTVCHPEMGKSPDGAMDVLLSPILAGSPRCATHRSNIPPHTNLQQSTLRACSKTLCPLAHQPQEQFTLGNISGIDLTCGAAMVQEGNASQPLVR